jgi:hypothetical protein
MNKTDRRDIILENAENLKQVIDVVRRVLGEGVDIDLVHLVYDNMRMNQQMDPDMLEEDLKNARGLAEQFYGAVQAKKPDVVVGVYERCMAMPAEED